MRVPRTTSSFAEKGPDITREFQEATDQIAGNVLEKNPDDYYKIVVPKKSDVMKQSIYAHIHVYE